MLKELFESSFYYTFPKRSDWNINLIETMYTGDFSLVDSKACQGCKQVCNPVLSERKQLLIHSSSGINTIKVDDVFEPVDENLGEMCDYVLDDGRKFALIEMTCATKEYVESKREKCLGQLSNTLAILLTCGQVRLHIENKEEREVVFSWRETNGPLDSSDHVETSMAAMTALADEVYSTDNISKFEWGFLYREIRYPNVYNW